jgi:hypothetical protein
MARKASVEVLPPAEELIEFRDLPPRGQRQGVAWHYLLEPLLKRPGQWARIHIAESPDQAMNAQHNLHRRNVTIPMPAGDWEFASRGCEVYAKYKGGGKRRGSVSRAKPVR